MIPANAPLKYQFRPFHHDEVLLLQSLISELIHAHQTLNLLKDTLKSDHPSPNRIKALLFQLAGTGDQYFRLFKWNDDGIMAKIKNYAALVVQYTAHGLPIYEILSQNAFKGWLVALELIDRFQLKPDLTNHDKQLAKLSGVIQQLMQIMGDLVIHYKHNENLMFCLVRHREEIDAIVAKDFVANLCLKMFSNGLHDVECMLIEKYRERGFHNLVSQIQTYCEVV